MALIAEKFPLDFREVQIVPKSIRSQQYFLVLEFLGRKLVVAAFEHVRHQFFVIGALVFVFGDVMRATVDLVGHVERSLLFVCHEIESLSEENAVDRISDVVAFECAGDGMQSEYTKRGRAFLIVHLNRPERKFLGPLDIIQFLVVLEKSFYDFYQPPRIDSRVNAEFGPPPHSVSHEHDVFGDEETVFAAFPEFIGVGGRAESKPEFVSLAVPFFEREDLLPQIFASHDLNYNHNAGLNHPRAAFSDLAANYLQNKRIILHEQLQRQRLHSLDLDHFHHSPHKIPHLQQPTPIRRYTLANSGYNVFTGDSTLPTQITRMWLNLIPHYSLTIAAKIYKIDSWPNATLFVMADGSTAGLFSFDSSNPGTSDLCGNPNPIPDSINTNYNDNLVTLNVTIAHSASSLTLTFISNLMGSAGSWGIRELNITMEACDESCDSCTNGSNFDGNQRPAPPAIQQTAWSSQAPTASVPMLCRGDRK